MGITPHAWALCSPSLLSFSFPDTVMLFPYTDFENDVCHVLYLACAQERKQMSRYLKFVVGCHCRPAERDIVLKGAAGELFDSSEIPAHRYRKTATATAPSTSQNPNDAISELPQKSLPNGDGLQSAALPLPVLDIPTVTIQSPEMRSSLVDRPNSTAQVNTSVL